MRFGHSPCSSTILLSVERVQNYMLQLYLSVNLSVLNCTMKAKSVAFFFPTMINLHRLSIITRSDENLWKAGIWRNNTQEVNQVTHGQHDKTK